MKKQTKIERLFDECRNHAFISCYVNYSSVTSYSVEIYFKGNSIFKADGLISLKKAAKKGLKFIKTYKHEEPTD